MNKLVNPAFTLVLLVITEHPVHWVVLEPVDILYYILGTLSAQGISYYVYRMPRLQRNSVPSSTTIINTTTKEWKQTTKTLSGSPTSTQLVQSISKQTQRRLQLLRILPKE